MLPANINISKFCNSSFIPYDQADHFSKGMCNALTLIWLINKHIYGAHDDTISRLDDCDKLIIEMQQFVKQKEYTYLELKNCNRIIANRLLMRYRLSVQHSLNTAINSMSSYYLLDEVHQYLQ